VVAFRGHPVVSLASPGSNVLGPAGPHRCVQSDCCLVVQPDHGRAGGGRPRSGFYLANLASQGWSSLSSGSSGPHASPPITGLAIIALPRPHGPCSRFGVAPMIRLDCFSVCFGLDRCGRAVLPSAWGGKGGASEQLREWYQFDQNPSI